MARNTNIFYAYPAQPPSIGEAINGAIQNLRKDSEVKRYRARFKTWPEMDVSGRDLPRTVLRQIDRAEIFACDLTYPNMNVSFELGYAIGRFKRVFVSLDVGIKTAQSNFDTFNFSLTGLGYAPYNNHLELGDSLLHDRPWANTDQKLLDARYRSPVPRPDRPRLLYVKPGWNTDSVITTEELLRSSEFRGGLYVDDPNENPSQLLDWYASEATAADAVIVHFLSDDHKDSMAHNMKASLIAGLSHGLNRQLLMLAHEPFQKQADYRHLLRTHQTAESCKQQVGDWVASVAANLPRRRPVEWSEAPPNELELRHLTVGRNVAEHEQTELSNYFVETPSYDRAAGSSATVLVGRRGSGKTAIMYGLLSKVQRDRRDHATPINPVGYEIDGLVRVLSSIEQRSERGFLIESLWKYLIYSEIALSMELELTDRIIHQPLAQHEKDFLAYCESRADAIKPPFSERLDNAIRSLEGVGTSGSGTPQRLLVSEGLHNDVLRELRKHIGAILGSARTLVVVIDNLDRPWSAGPHLEQLSELIGGLLAVIQSLPQDLARADHGLISVNAQITVLLRSDIFASVRPLISEPDKLPIERVTWDNGGLLLRVLDERLLLNTPNSVDTDELWGTLFPEEVGGISAREFILRSTLPRPRDLIYLVTDAINNAKSIGQGIVSTTDLIKASEKYSEWLFDAVQVEDDPRKGKLAAVMLEFVSSTPNVSSVDVEDCITRAGVEEQDLEYYVNLLCDIGFLGIARNGTFQYATDERQRLLWRDVANRIASVQGIQETYEIHTAFRSVLGITE